MVDVYPVPCDQVSWPLPAPGTDDDIRNKKKTKTPVSIVDLLGCVKAFLGSVCSQVGTVRGLIEGQGSLGFRRLQKPSVMALNNYCQTFPMIPENPALLIPSDPGFSETA